MTSPAKPWTEKDEERRTKILAMAKAHGVSQKDLAEAAGVNEVKLHRWTRGAAHLEDAQLAKMAALVQAAPARVDPVLAAEGDEIAAGARPAQAGTGEGARPAVPEGVKRALDVLDSLAGPEPATDEDGLRAMARRHTNAAFGTFVRLMVGAKSDTVKLRAAEMVMERGYGRPLQAVIDVTPKPPAEDRDLIAVFQKINGEEAAADEVVGD